MSLEDTVEAIRLCRQLAGLDQELINRMDEMGDAELRRLVDVRGDLVQELVELDQHDGGKRPGVLRPLHAELERELDQSAVRQRQLVERLGQRRERVVERLKALETAAGRHRVYRSSRVPRTKVRLCDRRG